jgi:integrase
MYGTARLVVALREHFDARGATPLHSTPALFDFDARDLNEIVREASQAAGVPGFTPHMLRHAFASWLAREGVPLPDIQRLMGHSSIQMTARYAQWAPADAGARAIAALRAEPLHSQSPSRSRDAGG